MSPFSSLVTAHAHSTIGSFSFGINEKHLKYCPERSSVRGVEHCLPGRIWSKKLKRYRWFVSRRSDCRACDYDADELGSLHCSASTLVLCPSHTGKPGTSRLSHGVPDYPCGTKATFLLTATSRMEISDLINRGLTMSLERSETRSLTICSSIPSGKVELLFPIASLVSTMISLASLPLKSSVLRLPRGPLLASWQSFVNFYALRNLVLVSIACTPISVLYPV